MKKSLQRGGAGGQKRAARVKEKVHKMAMRPAVMHALERETEMSCTCAEQAEWMTKKTVGSWMQ